MGDEDHNTNRIPMGGGGIAKRIWHHAIVREAMVSPILTASIDGMARWHVIEILTFVSGSSLQEKQSKTAEPSPYDRRPDGNQHMVPTRG